MGDIKFIDKCQVYFFDREKAINELTPGQLEKLKRYEEVFVYWLDNSYLPDKDIVDHLINNNGISRSHAYREVAEIKYLLGNVQKASKEWQRHRANEMISEGYKLAKEAKDSLDVKKAEIMIKAGKAFEGVNRLNKFEPEEIDWSKIVPPAFEPVYDPELIDKNKSIKDIEKETLRLKKELKLIEDIDYEDVY